MVAVTASPAVSDDPNAFSLMRLACPALVLRGGSDSEYLLIGDNTCQIRLDVRSGTILDGPVRLHYDLAGSEGVVPKLLTLRRLLILIRRQRLPRGSFPSPYRARRWMMALRALDARRAGATHREIAVALFGAATVEADWDGPSAYLRCRIQRLILMGELLVGGGYLRLLR